MNVEIFARYIFSHYSGFSNIRENIYNLKITCIMPHRGNNIKDANLSPPKIVNFHKFAKIYAHKNIYIHSIFILNLNIIYNIVTLFSTLTRYFLNLSIGRSQTTSSPTGPTAAPGDPPRQSPTPRCGPDQNPVPPAARPPGVHVTHAVTRGQHVRHGLYSYL